MKKLQGIEPRQKNKISEAIPNVAATVEAVFGCKWSLQILRLIREGINRPGANERALEGLTPKSKVTTFTA